MAPVETHWFSLATCALARISKDARRDPVVLLRPLPVHAALMAPGQLCCQPDIRTGGTTTMLPAPLHRLATQLFDNGVLRLLLRATATTPLSLH